MGGGGEEGDVLTNKFKEGFLWGDLSLSIDRRAACRGEGRYVGGGAGGDQGMSVLVVGDGTQGARAQGPLCRGEGKAGLPC